MNSSKFFLSTLIAAAAMTAPAYATEPTIEWGIAGNGAFKWNDSDNNWIVGSYSNGAFSWSETTGDPGRVENKGFVLYFEGQDADWGSFGSFNDTSDGGGIVVKGTGNTVTVSMGQWAGSIQVDAGNVLNTSWGYELKDGSIVANGTVNITSNSLDIDVGTSNEDRVWYVGSKGSINFSNVTELKDANVVVSGAVDNTAGSLVGLTNRASGVVVESKDLVNFKAGLSTGLDRLSVGTIYGADDAALTSVDSAAELTSAGQYFAEKTESGIKVHYTINGAIFKKTLTWSGTDGDSWSQGGTTWVDLESAVTSFVNGDDVVFDFAGNTNITVGDEGVQVDNLAVFQGSVALTGGEVVVDGVATIKSNAALAYQNMTRQSIVLNADGGTFSKSGSGALTVGLASGSTGALKALNVSSGSVVANNDIVLGSESIVLSADATLTNDTEFGNGSYDLTNISGNGRYIFNAHTGNGGAWGGGLGVNLSDNFTGEFVLNKNIWLSFAKEHSSFGNATVVLSGNALFHSTQTVDFKNNIRFDGSAEIWTDANNATVTLSGEVTGDTLVRKGGGAMIFANTLDVTTFNQEVGSTQILGTAKIDTLNVSGGSITTTAVDGWVVGKDGNVGNITLSSGGEESALRGKLTINDGGVVSLNAGDATGWGGGATTSIHTLVINEGGKLKITTNSNTGSNQTFNMSGNITLKGGTIEGTDDYSKFDLYASGMEVKSESSSETSLISASVGLRKSGIFNVEKGTTKSGIDLHVSGMLTNLGKINTQNMDAISVLTKKGLGTLKLSGDNQYWSTGGTIEAGTLIAAHGNALGTGEISVYDGAKLQLAKSVTSGTVKLLAGAELVVDFNDFANVPATTDATQEIALTLLTSGLIIDGTTIADGTNLNESYSDYFKVLNAGDYVNQLWSYDKGALSLTLAIPEPSVFGLLAGLGALALAGTRRRRRC